MKLYYISTKDEHYQARKLFASSHYIDLPDGTILIVAEFGDNRSESRWKNRVNVKSLPHPLSGQNIGPEIASHLSHLGITASHSVFEMSQLVAKIHPELSMYAQR